MDLTTTLHIHIDGELLTTMKPVMVRMTQVAELEWTNILRQRG